MSTPAKFNDPFGEYLQLVSAGLKHVDTEQRNDVLAEIRSHLAERADQFRQKGSPQPEKDAIQALGDPKTLALQFSLEALEQKASRSFRPWVLLRASWRMAIVGVRGTIVFFIGLLGYTFAICTLAAPLVKLFIPQTGMWIGPHDFVIAGVPGNPAGAHEVAGANFAYIMVLLSFLSGSATTFLLRWFLRFWKPARPSLRAPL